MPAVTGVTMVMRIGQAVQTLTLTGGSGDTFRLGVSGVSTGALSQTIDAASLETALEGLAPIGAGNVTVAGAAGGPYTLTYVGTWSGAAPVLVPFAATGTLVTVIAEDTPTSIVTVAAGRTNSLNRGTTAADASSKDLTGWNQSLPTIREWSVDFTHMYIDGDVGQDRLEAAFLNAGRINVQIQMPSGTEYTGYGTLSELNMEGPHDDVVSISGSILGSGALSKV